MLIGKREKKDFGLLWGSGAAPPSAPSPRPGRARAVRALREERAAQPGHGCTPGGPKGLPRSQAPGAEPDRPRSPGEEPWPQEVTRTLRPEPPEIPRGAGGRAGPEGGPGSISGDQTASQAQHLPVSMETPWLQQPRSDGR